MGDPLFFCLAEGASCAVGAISRTAGGGLAQWGGRTAGANHRIVGVIFRTAGSFLRSRGDRWAESSHCRSAFSYRRSDVFWRRGESAYSVLILPRMRARPLRVRGVAPMPGFELRFVHRRPCSGIHRQRVEDGIERPIGVHRRLLVVGTAALAAVAAENPAVEVDPSGRLPFDGVARDAPARVDHLRGDDGARGTALDAVAAAAAAGTLERGVVGVGFVGQEQLAQQDIGAVAGRDEQRLAAYPAQSGLDGELFFEQRGRIDERPAAESGNGGFQMFQHAVQHSFYRRVIVRRAGIGGDFGAVSGGIPFADAAFVTYGARPPPVRAPSTSLRGSARFSTLRSM